MMCSIIYDKNDLEMAAIIGDGDDRIVLDHTACTSIDWAEFARGGIIRAACPTAAVTVTPVGVYFTIRRHIYRVNAAEFITIAATISRAAALLASATVWN